MRRNAKIDVVLYHNDNPEEFLGKNSVKSLLPEKCFKDLFPRNECTFYL